MDVAHRIRSKLIEALAPSHLEVIDESARHAGHAGARPEGETHFRILVVSQGFAGQSRLDRHRSINKILEVELAERVHALAIRALAPDEHEIS